VSAAAPLGRGSSGPQNPGQPHYCRHAGARHALPAARPSTLPPRPAVRRLPPDALQHRPRQKTTADPSPVVGHGGGQCKRRLRRRRPLPVRMAAEAAPVAAVAHVPVPTAARFPSLSVGQRRPPPPVSPRILMPVHDPKSKAAAAPAPRVARGDTVAARRPRRCGGGTRAAIASAEPVVRPHLASAAVVVKASGAPSIAGRGGGAWGGKEGALMFKRRRSRVGGGVDGVGRRVAEGRSASWRPLREGAGKGREHRKAGPSSNASFPW